MIGTIIGDIAGSRFEFNNHKSKDFILMNKACFFTDDSVMSLAVAKALYESKKHGIDLKNQVIKWMQYFGRLYPNAGYGSWFNSWIYSNKPKPYNSYGNGAGMRVSPCGHFAKNLDEVKRLSKIVTEVTHNHPEGIKAAEAIAVSVFLAKSKYNKNEIRKHINKYYYKLDFTLDEIRPTYTFDVSAQNSTPQAIQAFLESNGFEDAIRNAVSIGGDSDTIAAMTGAIAEAYYGVYESLEETALTYLSEPLKSVYYVLKNSIKKRG